MKDLTLESFRKMKSGKVPLKLEKLKSMLNPDGFRNGAMKINPDSCNSCGYCIQNCPVKCIEMNENNIPRMKKDAICFSCSNCIVACPENAISISEVFYHKKDSFFDFGTPPLKMPMDPKNADGNPDSWNEVEQIILKRRSVRHFKKDPVPDHLIRRILEAGRFAPSGGNHQPWKFTVVTDSDFIASIEEVCHSFWVERFAAYKNENKLMNIILDLMPGNFDTRTQYGSKCIALKELPVFFNAPALIFIEAHKCLNDPEMSIGICGENMNIVANSLGLGVCWSNFGNAVNYIPELKSRLGFGEPWKVESVLALGYPKFRQNGMVARHYRPVRWFRPGSVEPAIEE